MQTATRAFPIHQRCLPRHTPGPPGSPLSPAREGTRCLQKRAKRIESRAARVGGPSERLVEAGRLVPVLLAWLIFYGIAITGSLTDATPAVTIAAERAAASAQSR
jgi:hypothetical protein